MSARACTAPIVALADIESVTLRRQAAAHPETDEWILERRPARGNFLLEEWGSGKLFINRDSPPYLVVRTRDTFVVVNFEDAARTRELSRQLIGLTGREKTGGQVP